MLSFLYCAEAQKLLHQNTSRRPFIISQFLSFSQALKEKE